MKRVYAVPRSKLNGTERMVLLVLAERTGDTKDGYGQNWSELMQCAGLARSTLGDALNALDQAGFIARSKGTWVDPETKKSAGNVFIRLTIEPGRMGPGVKQFRRARIRADLQRLDDARKRS